MKSLLIAIPIIIILFLAGSFFLGKQEKKTSQTNQAGTTAQTSTPLPMVDSRYSQYSDKNLKTLADKRRVLFFFANWCPTCRPLNEEIVKRINDIPDDVAIIRVNYNDTDTDAQEEALATKYNVTYQHTFVEIDKNEEVIQIWNGGDLDSILERLAR